MTLACEQALVERGEEREKRIDWPITILLIDDRQDNYKMAE